MDELLVPNAEERVFVTQARGLAADLETPLDVEHPESPRETDHSEAQQDEEYLDVHQGPERLAANQDIEHVEAQQCPEDSAAYCAITVRKRIMTAIAASKHQHALAVIYHYFAVATRVLGPCPSEEEDEEILKEPKRPAGSRRGKIRRSIHDHRAMERILESDEVQAEDEMNTTTPSVTVGEVLAREKAVYK